MIDLLSGTLSLLLHAGMPKRAMVPGRLSNIYRNTSSLQKLVSYVLFEPYEVGRDPSVVSSPL